MTPVAPHSQTIDRDVALGYAAGGGNDDNDQLQGLKGSGCVIIRERGHGREVRTCDITAVRELCGICAS